MLFILSRTVHLSQISPSCSTAPPCSVFFLGGSVEFPNLSFSSELADFTSPQFRLQAQALNHYVSGTAILSVTASPLNDTLECCLTLMPLGWSWSCCCCSDFDILLYSRLLLLFMSHIQNTAALLLLLCPCFLICRVSPYLLQPPISALFFLHTTFFCPFLFLSLVVLNVKL